MQARDVIGGVHFHGPRPARWTPPRQLPADVRGYVNRTEELEHLDRILAAQRESRSVSPCIVTGTAGVGKTSLAVHWAHRIAADFPDGQLYANLHGYDPGPPVTPLQALDDFLRALRVPPELIPDGLEPRAAAYRSLLAGRRVLVLLDNASGVAQVRPLLPGTAGCLVVITSRNRLSGLVARDGAHRLSLDVLTEEQAVELLRGVTDGYRPPDDPDELRELARLCARLPLALRIAAERAGSRPHTPLRDLVEELRDESMLWDALTSGDDDADAVRTVFAWSYRALPAAASRLFRLLGLHPGAEFGPAAAAALAGVEPRVAGRLLDDLVGVHLVERVSSDRFGFHDLLRAYAVDQVRREEDSGSAAAAVRRLVLWYLHSAAAAARAVHPHDRTPRLPPADGVTPLAFPAREQAAAWLEREWANLVAVIHAAERHGVDEAAWLLHAVLRTHFAETNRFDDWLTSAGIALRAVRGLGDRGGEAQVLESLGKAEVQRGRLAEGIGLHRAALAIRQELGDRRGVLASANAIGLAFLREHRPAEALASFERARGIAVETGDRYWDGISAGNTAAALAELERFAEAERWLRRALKVFRELGDRICEGDALHGLSQVHRALGRLPEAHDAIRAAVDIARDGGHLVAEAFWLVELGRVEAASGRPERALVAHQRAAALQRGLGDVEREALAFDAVGEVYAQLDRPHDAAGFHAMAVAALRGLGNRWQLARALVNLAAVADGERAADALAEARELLADFDDPAARELRRRIEPPA
ncbi:tetratricopeptide (TPR) repeat protein [Saccharothrix coeruleofusca]|uniref:ATP-binding protein n=1 Tax=Saccharothrix coeruleofusca TaxID=33919 RepID=UPI0027DE9C9C|nr:tetratricopeptide repeat protein [Saccharothrix coeruleofusca]MBP2338997.1 tetratricopeptide (TPR) repeat protein [Saccharothrix coeruleofusca]